VRKFAVYAYASNRQIGLFFHCAMFISANNRDDAYTSAMELLKSEKLSNEGWDNHDVNVIGEYEWNPYYQP